MHTLRGVVGKKAGFVKREGWCRRRGYENVYGIALCSHRLADSTRWYYDNTKFVLVCKGVSFLSLFFINTIFLSHNRKAD